MKTDCIFCVKRGATSCRAASYPISSPPAKPGRMAFVAGAILVLSVALGVLSASITGTAATRNGYSDHVCPSASVDTSMFGLSVAAAEPEHLFRWPLTQPICWWDGRVVRRRPVRRCRRRGPGTRAQIERERRELHERTCREIDAIVAEFHAQLPRHRAKAIGAAYARYSTRHQDSIVDQVRAIFEYALAEESRNGGRRSKDGERRSRPRVLRRLFYCPEHERPLYVGGAYGRNLYCPFCDRLPPEERTIYSLLNRELALQRTCETLSELVRADAPLVKTVVEACRREAEALQRRDPEGVRPRGFVAQQTCG